MYVGEPSSTFSWYCAPPCSLFDGHPFRWWRRFVCLASPAAGRLALAPFLEVDENEGGPAPHISISFGWPDPRRGGWIHPRHVTADFCQQILLMCVSPPLSILHPRATRSFWVSLFLFRPNTSKENNLQIGRKIQLEHITGNRQSQDRRNTQVFCKQCVDKAHELAGEKGGLTVLVAFFSFRVLSAGMPQGRYFVIQ